MSSALLYTMSQLDNCVDYKTPLYFESVYYTMCFEFEIPNKKKDKNLNMTDEEFEVEPELEKVQEPVTVSAK
jgi:hypothetical protein